MKDKRFPPLPSWKHGTQFRNTAGNLCHYIGFIYDGDTRLHTYKYWLKHSKKWCYCILTEKELTKLQVFFNFVKL